MQGMGRPGLPRFLAEVVDRQDVRVLDARERLGFTLEPREPLGIAGYRFRKNLDGDISLETLVARAVHLAHAAGADEVDDAIMSEDAAAHAGEPRSPRLPTAATEARTS